MASQGVMGGHGSTHSTQAAIGGIVSSILSNQSADTNNTASNEPMSKVNIASTVANQDAIDELESGIVLGVSRFIDNLNLNLDINSSNNNAVKENKKDQIANYLKKNIHDTARTFELTALGTDMNPNNDDDFLTINVAKSTATVYDFGISARASAEQSMLKILDFELFDDFVQVDLAIDTQFLVAEGGFGTEINNVGFESVVGGYATYFEGGLIPEIKIGKLGLKARGYALGGGDGVYTKGGINYHDSNGRWNLINAEGVIEYFAGLKLNVNIYWE